MLKYIFNFKHKTSFLKILKPELLYLKLNQKK